MRIYFEVLLLLVLVTLGSFFPSGRARLRKLQAAGNHGFRVRGFAQVRVQRA
jgi:hypothetical protein